MNFALSIIIVNWNVADLLVDAIQSILDNPPSRAFEIIVVDNASSDDSLIKVHQLFPQVKVITNKHNVGFSRANNQGMEIAEGETIFLLNPDTVVIEDAIDKMLNLLDQHQDYGMVGPQLLSAPNGNPTLAAARLSRTLISGVLLDLLYIQRLPFWGPKIVKRLRYPYNLYQGGCVEVISGAAMMFRKSTVEKIGGLNEKFFMAGEDVEFCDRFRNNGLKIYYHPAAQIIHYDQSCTPKNPVDIFINRFMSVAKYYEIKYGLRTYQKFKWISLLVLVPNFLIKSVYYFLRRDILRHQINKMKFIKLIHWKYVGEAEFLN